jgi:two-component system phosphate regulon sensor histidine kinase PhoR
MIEPFGGRVIGTLEAGYDRTYREDIYERDVQILESFVDHVVYTLERKRSGFLDKIAHEIRSPLVGIRSNASFLQKRGAELSPELVDRKLEDILTDSSILLYQFSDLEYILEGHVPRKAKIEKTFIFRDVIIKTINQLHPVITEAGFSFENVKYEHIDPSLLKVQTQTDKLKINQVVYNLLINAIKYAKTDPNQFKIVVDIDDKNRDTYILKFKDWGIGIKEADRESIFKEGFRSSEAKKKDVTGSGLGLHISKIIMGNLGGELVLSHLSEPTEFHLIIPKRFPFPIKNKNQQKAKG